MVSIRAKTIVNVISVGWGLIGVVALVPAGLSVMIFDAPGSEKQLGTVWRFRAVANFPLVCFLVMATALILNCSDRRKLAFMFLPLMNIAIGIAAVITIDRVQRGQFA